MVRQLAEKVTEHNSWCKAYDSVSQAALWVATEKSGVPEEMVDLVKSIRLK